MKSLRGPVVLGLLLALGVGCRPGRVERVYPAPSAGELAGLVSARQAGVRTANARLRATSFLGGERIRATVLALMDRKGALRLEAEVSLQGTVAVLATDGHDFALFDVRENVVRRGPACPANIASIIHIPMNAAEVAAILLGDVPWQAPAAGPGHLSVEWDAARGADVLLDADANLRLLFVREGGVHRLVGAEKPGSGGYRLRFEDFERSGGVELPRRLSFAEAGKSFDDGVVIDVKERSINEPLSADKFVLVDPAGARVEAIGCGE